MKYSEIVRNNRTELSEREDLEWINFWWDHANSTGEKRILLIGDSTARMVRSTLGKILNQPVDLFATSSGLHDSLFINQVDCFYNAIEYKYDCIFVQLGHHAELGLVVIIFQNAIGRYIGMNLEISYYF